ncbi:MAG: ThiF family adenylyltransferase [Phycisphaerales bacterium]
MTEPREHNRYLRQETLPQIGPEGQGLLGAAHVAVVGCGALGCVSADLLARAGVGRLTLIDRDVVETVNLHRQTLFDQSQVGTPKAVAAHDRLVAVNPEIDLAARIADVVPANAEEIVGFGRPGAPAVLVDGTDNFETRFLLNDLSVKHGVALVYGGGIGTSGAVAVFGLPEGPCVRCVFDGPPAPGSQPTCESAGVLGPVTAAVGARQAALAIRAIVEPAWDDAALERFDLWAGVHTRVALERDPDCACCVRERFEFLDSPEAPAEATLCGRDAVQIPASGPVDLEALAARLGGSFAAGPFMLRGAIEDGRYELTVFGDGRAIVRGTRDPAEARTVHARYVGS